MKAILMAIALLVIGFVLLIKGADYFVDGSSAVAKKLKVPPLIIGFTIVAMGTSLPECAVSVAASVTNNNALAVSNAVGSNIFNLMVVCGICALIVPLTVQIETLKKEFPFSVFCALLLLVLGYWEMNLGRMEGIILIVIFACYLLWMIFSALKARREAGEEEIDTFPAWKCIVYIIGGAAAIKFGGDFVVDGATMVARSFGLTQTLIGLTVVAVGTSLPELVTSIVAAKKNEPDMAVGNVVGSNIFNILLVLGVASSISPIAFLMENVVDIVILVGFSIVVWLMAWTKKRLSRREGIIMLLLYLGYMVYICMR